MNNMFYKLMSSYFKALAHPTRLKIINILKEDELCVCVLLEKLELEQSNVSQHLRVLKDQNILASRRNGSKIMYKVKDKNVFDILNKANESLLNQLSETQNQLMNGGI